MQIFYKFLKDVYSINSCMGRYIHFMGLDG